MNKFYQIYNFLIIRREFVNLNINIKTSQSLIDILRY